MWQGNNIYLGAGGLVSILTAMFSARVVQPQITTRLAMTVGTNGITGNVAYKNNLFLTNAGAVRIISPFQQRRRLQANGSAPHEGEQKGLSSSSIRGFKKTKTLMRVPDVAALLLCPPAPVFAETPSNATLGQEFEAATGPLEDWGPLGNPKLRNSLLVMDNVFIDKIIKRIPKPEEFVADDPGSRSRHPYLRNPITRGDRKYDVHDMIFNLPHRLGAIEAQTIEEPNGLWVGTNDTNSCLIVNSESNGKSMPTNNGNCQTLNYASAVPNYRYTHEHTSHREIEANVR